MRRQGQNCALKYQDEVESNISFVDWKAKRTHNNRRPVLGQAAPWKRLDCAAQTKIDDMDFSEFVVRRDCPVRKPGGSTGNYRKDSWADCVQGVKANAPTQYTHDDRTDPSRMKNRPYTGQNTVQREPMLTTPHLCEFLDADTFSRVCRRHYDGAVALNRAVGDPLKYVPVEQLNTIAYKHLTNIRNQDYSTSNVYKSVFQEDPDGAKAINWRQNGAEAAPHLIPPSYKGWIWCEDVHENADPVGGNMGYCMGAHYGNQRSNVEGSFEEWGVAEAMKNHIQTWELGGFKYKQDPLKYFSIKGAMVEESSSDPYGINKAYKDASIVRPMTNALVLKNDEAGIDGVGILCSNRPLDIPEAELVKVKDVTTNMCGQGKTVCSRENVTTAGTGIVADGAVVQSAMVIEQGLTGKMCHTRVEARRVQ